MRIRPICAEELDLFVEAGGNPRHHEEVREYIQSMLAAGTATLASVRTKGATVLPLRADTDVANAPMAAAFRRAGWVAFARRREFVVDLTADPERRPRFEGG